MPGTGPVIEPAGMLSGLAAEAQHEVQRALTEARQEVQQALRQAGHEVREALHEAHREVHDALVEADQEVRESVDGIPVPIVAGTRVDEAIVEPPVTSETYRSMPLAETLGPIELPRICIRQPRRRAPGFPGLVTSADAPGPGSSTPPPAPAPPQPPAPPRQKPASDSEG